MGTAKRTRKKKKERKEVGPMATTGSTMFDKALGGGFPWGKIVNLVGDNSTGKTLVASEVIYQQRKLLGKKLKWEYDDAEAGFSFDTEDMYGFSIIKPRQDNSYTVKDFSANLSKEIIKLKKDEYLIYVLDCFDALTSDEEIARDQKALKGEVQKGSYNLNKQKDLGSFFRLRAKEIDNKNVLLIIISQVRMNIGVTFGRKYTRTGGKALDHYASQIIWLSVCDKVRAKIKSKTHFVGVTIKALISKNKVGRPFLEAYFDILWDYGVDDISSCLDYYLDLRTAERGQLKEKKIAKGLKFNGETFTDKVELIQYIEDNGLYKKLKKLCQKNWDALQSQLKPKRRKK